MFSSSIGGTYGCEVACFVAVCGRRLGCGGLGGDSGSDTTIASVPATTTTPPVDTTTTTETPAEPVPAFVTFDGSSCTVTGGPVEPGLSQISVLNTSSIGAEALLIKLNSAYTVETLTVDVSADRYDRWHLEGNDDPRGFDEVGGARLPQNASEATVQPFTASTGTWGVVCLDLLNVDAYLGSDVIEVS